MAFCVTTAVLQMGLSVHEAVRAATYGGALALGRHTGEDADGQRAVGSLAVGHRADVQLLNAPAGHASGLPARHAADRRRLAQGRGGGQIGIIPVLGHSMSSNICLRGECVLCLLAATVLAPRTGQGSVAVAGAAMVQLQGAVDEGEMAEGLRGVSELPAGLRIPFLAEQADVVA